MLIRGKQIIVGDLLAHGTVHTVTMSDHSYVCMDSKTM